MVQLAPVGSSFPASFPSHLLLSSSPLREKTNPILGFTPTPRVLRFVESSGDSRYEMRAPPPFRSIIFAGIGCYLWERYPLGVASMCIWWADSGAPVGKGRVTLHVAATRGDVSSGVHGGCVASNCLIVWGAIGLAWIGCLG